MLPRLLSSSSRPQNARSAFIRAMSTTQTLSRLLSSSGLRRNARSTFVRAMSTTQITTPTAIGLDAVGIKHNATVFRNLSYDDIAKHEMKNGEGEFTKSGAFAVDTGKFTGRSPNDKYTVEQAPSKDNIWWGSVNKPMKPEVFDELYGKVLEHYAKVDNFYVFDGYCGSNPKSQKKVRIITEMAWQHHFVTNMFIRPKTKEEVADWKPQFTIINCCKIVNENYKKHGLNSDVFASFNIEKNLAIIGGTYYGGEMKKGVFSMMNYWLPLEGIMSMHCSANKGKNGDTALFFGLSGTGKTTLSADPNRFLIGDDEHGWNEDGVFNFEGGCYAKTIDLSEENEPDIYRAIKKNALLENVWIEKDGTEDYYNSSKTQNGRVSYPIHHISNYDESAGGTHPKNCVFLTCDAYGVLPPVSKLSPGQAMYHFLSGYTAKVAGTERGIIEPVATFSACFGAAFLTLHPTKYADLLQKKLEEHGTNVFLVNTGWSGGQYGTGKRMSIKTTRECIDRILDGSINNSEFETDPVFGLSIPKTLGDIPKNVLNPRESWSDKNAYDETAKKLAGMFKDNFKDYVSVGHTDYTKFGPIV